MISRCVHYGCEVESVWGRRRAAASEVRCDAGVICNRKTWVNKQLLHIFTFSGARVLTQECSQAVCASTVCLSICLRSCPSAHLPRGSSPSSRRHRTVGAGSPWTSHRKSTVSSSMTTWLTGLRTNTGRSARQQMPLNMTTLCSSKDWLRNCLNLTIHHQLCRITVPLSNHVTAHADVHACIALPGVRDHQFATTHLKNTMARLVMFALMLRSLIAHIQNTVWVTVGVRVYVAVMFIFYLHSYAWGSQHRFTWN